MSDVDSGRPAGSVNADRDPLLSVQRIARLFDPGERPGIECRLRGIGAEGYEARDACDHSSMETAIDRRSEELHTPTRSG